MITLKPIKRVLAFFAEEDNVVVCYDELTYEIAKDAIGWYKIHGAYATMKYLRDKYSINNGELQSPEWGKEHLKGRVLWPRNGEYQLTGFFHQDLGGFVDAVRWRGMIYVTLENGNSYSFPEKYLNLKLRKKNARDPLRIEMIPEESPSLFR